MDTLLSLRVSNTLKRIAQKRSGVNTIFCFCAIKFDRSILSCDIFYPFVFHVVNIDCRDLHKFIQCQDKCNEKHRCMPDKCCQHTKRNDKTPECDNVTDHTELCIAARREDTGNDRRIQRISDDIIFT